MFSAMNFAAGVLSLIDQKKLPTNEVWVRAQTLEDVAIAIETMVVRGAPAIGCAAAWGLVVDAFDFQKQNLNATWTTYAPRFEKGVVRLANTRPTAVNLFYALNEMKNHTLKFRDSDSIERVVNSLLEKAEMLAADDIRTCKLIGDFGASLFSKPINVLTHCNTGSLATAGYGTALGVIRSLHQNGLLKQVFVDETRPYLQGSRLTAFELSQDKIPYQLIADNMAAYAMQKGWVDLVVIGADRIAANGDTANKIGSYGLAVLCKHHGIPFMVAAPHATIDKKMSSGKLIPVEERPPTELLEIQGSRIAPEGAKVWNPSFDVTPENLISYIATETGLFAGPYSF